MGVVGALGKRGESAVRPGLIDRFVNVVPIVVKIQLILRTSHGIEHVGYGLVPLPQHLLQPLDGQPVVGEIVFHDYAVHNQLDREGLDGRGV